MPLSPSAVGAGARRRAGGAAVGAEVLARLALAEVEARGERGDLLAELVLDGDVLEREGRARPARGRGVRVVGLEVDARAPVTKTTLSSVVLRYLPSPISRSKRGLFGSFLDR